METEKAVEKAVETSPVEAVKEEKAFEPTPLVNLFGNSPSSVETEKVDKSQVEKAVEKVEKVIDTKEPEKEIPPAVNWDDEINPYKSKASEYEKRYKDTQAWGNKAHQKLKEYGLDEGNQPPTAEEIQKQQEAFVTSFNDREKASYAAAVEIHGKEFVDKQLYAESSPFRKIMNDPVVFNRVQYADAPVLEALKQVKSYEFFKKYGSDVDKIPAKIKTELEADIREKITKELQGKLTKKENMPNTLSGIKSVDTKGDDEGSFTPTPLSRLFG